MVGLKVIILQVGLAGVYTSAPAILTPHQIAEKWNSGIKHTLISHYKLSLHTYIYIYIYTKYIIKDFGSGHCIGIKHMNHYTGLR